MSDYTVAGGLYGGLVVPLAEVMHSLLDWKSAAFSERSWCVTDGGLYKQDWSKFM